MRLSDKIKWTSGVLGAVSLAAGMLISDNDSVFFKLLVWLCALIPFAVGTLAGFGIGWLLSQVAFGIYTAFQKAFDDTFLSYEHKKGFFRGFYLLFFLFTTAVLLKFTMDYVFAQFVSVFLFWNGALGIFHGGLILLLKNRQKPENFRVLPNGKK